MTTTMDEREIVRDFTGSIHCSQVVIGQWADELGLDREEAMRMAGPLGGGCFQGEVCGCVTAALMVIGARYGHSELGDADGNAQMVAKVKEFEQRFSAENGRLVCKELCGHDLSRPGELDKAVADGSMMSICPRLVNSALGILDDIM